MGTIKQTTPASDTDMLIDTIFKFPGCSYKKRQKQDTPHMNMLMGIIFKLPDCSNKKDEKKQPHPKKTKQKLSKTKRSLWRTHWPMLFKCFPNE